MVVTSWSTPERIAHDAATGEVVWTTNAGLVDEQSQSWCENVMAFVLGEARLGVLICYEMLFRDLVAESVLDGEVAEHEIEGFFLLQGFLVKPDGDFVKGRFLETHSILRHHVADPCFLDQVVSRGHALIYRYIKSRRVTIDGHCTPQTGLQ